MVSRIYYSAPRGLASNTGFEAEDDARAEVAARIALSEAREAVVRAAKEYAHHLFHQDLLRFSSNEADALARIAEDVEALLGDHRKPE